MKQLTVVFWGTYDKTKPRNRILLQGLRENNVKVIECHTEIWTGVEDKSQLKGVATKLKFLLKWIFAWPVLMFRYTKLPPHDIVVIGYLGQLDVFFIWLLAKIRKKPVMLDIFISLYDTIVNDRKIISKWNPLAWAIYLLEWTAFRLTDINLIDTKEHCRYISEEFHIPLTRLKSVFVGIEDEVFFPTTKRSVNNTKNIKILFYGQFIPLHGISWIIKAAELAKDKPFQWTIIGKGQEEKRIKEQLAAANLDSVTWIPWIKYSQLVNEIHSADICLGIFGTTQKAARVIPNKVFQIIASGKPLITMDSPAARELLAPKPGVYLVPPGNPAAIVNALEKFVNEKKSINLSTLYSSEKMRITPKAIGKELIAILNEILRRK